MARRLNRRSFLTCVVGSSIVGGGAFARIGGAHAQITDNDPTDPRGRGRGITDRDSGPGADPAGRGRGSAPPARSCSRVFQGTFRFVQSNNITGEMRLRQNGDRVSGYADFYSPTLRTYIGGGVTGFVDGTTFTLRVRWIEARWRYSETGIYEGRIASNGSVTGHNYPFNRPQDRTSFLMEEPASCR